MAEGKKSFVLYADLLDNIEHLTNEEKWLSKINPFFLFEKILIF